MHTHTRNTTWRRGSGSSFAATPWRIRNLHYNEPGSLHFASASASAIAIAVVHRCKVYNFDSNSTKATALRLAMR